MSKITIRCIVCGRDTTLNNVQSGRKVFCLHCGHKITDCYQPGMEFNAYAEISNLDEGNIVPPSADSSRQHQENIQEPPQPDWKTEPYIRINWKRIGYTIKTVFKGFCSFFSKRWKAFQEGLHSDSALSNETQEQYKEGVNASSTPNAAPAPPEQGPELPFGHIDRRQARMQQSFSNTFADSGAIPVPPTDPNYSQQRIDQSFSNSFADSGAIPAPPANPNYSQQRIDQSFSNSFADNGAIPVPPSNPNYSQQRIDQSFTKSFQENENKQS